MLDLLLVAAVGRKAGAKAVLVEAKAARKRAERFMVVKGSAGRRLRVVGCQSFVKVEAYIYMRRPRTVLVLVLAQVAIPGRSSVVSRG